MIKLYATINLLRVEDCEIDQPAFSGMMPSFNIEGELIMCKIITTNGANLIERGVDNIVEIVLPYGERFEQFLHSGYKFTLNLGRIIIGHGIIEEICPVPCRSPK